VSGCCCPTVCLAGRTSSTQLYVVYSVADPGCLFRIPDPDFYPSRIADLGSRIQKQQQKKKKIWANFQRIIELLPKRLSLSYQKYGFGIRDPEKTYSGSQIQGSKIHRILDPDPGSGSATLVVYSTYSEQLERFLATGTGYYNTRPNVY
jgi:hypothetical protein